MDGIYEIPPEQAGVLLFLISLGAQALKLALAKAGKRPSKQLMTALALGAAGIAGLAWGGVDWRAAFNDLPPFWPDPFAFLWAALEVAEGLLARAGGFIVAMKLFYDLVLGRLYQIFKLAPAG